MRKKKVLRIIILALILVWMMIIFKLSGQTGDDSSSLSRTISSKFVKQESQIELIEPYIRKIAHLSEYACGGVLFLSLFLTYELSDFKQMIFSLLIGVEYAALDEIHQLFITGRSGQIVDVFIDSIGISLGICIWMLIYKIVTKVLRKRKDGVLE